MSTLVLTKERADGQPEFGYVALELENIRSLLPISCDLYIEEAGRHILYRSTNLPFTDLDCRRLLAAGVDRLWLLAAGGPVQATNPVMSLLAMPDEQVPPVVKAKVLYDSAINIAQQASTNPAIQAVMPSVTDLVGLTLNYLTTSAKAFGALLSVMRHDFSIYSHAVNVGFYAVGVGRTIGITSDEDLRNLGMGAFLHDIGKSNVPNKVLSKAGALSPDEWAIVRQHPGWGRQALAPSGDVPKVVLDIVGQHHERMDGSGYPNGIRDGQLHEYSKLVAIVDSFDAMTSDRPYRRGRSPYNALQIMKSELEGKLDPRLFAALVRMLRDLSQTK